MRLSINQIKQSLQEIKNKITSYQLDNTKISNYKWYLFAFLLLYILLSSIFSKTEYRYNLITNGNGGMYLIDKKTGTIWERYMTYEKTLYYNKENNKYYKSKYDNDWNEIDWDYKYEYFTIDWINIGTPPRKAKKKGQVLTTKIRRRFPE